MALTNRYDFVLLFDVKNGNPNGDPDAGNMPRIDPETYHGLVSDVSLKRKVRNYVELRNMDGEGEGRRIYVREASILNEAHREAFRAVRPDDTNVEKDAKLNPRDDAEAEKLRAFMCRNFFDIRTFGAVMSTAINCGQVRGPVQMSFASSIEPIVPVEISITRMAATNEKEKAERREGEGDPGDERTENRTMGRKHIVPYGLYRAHGYVSAGLAERTGFSETDLDLLFEALGSMFEHDRSAARGEMSTCRLVAFRHVNRLGKAPARALFDRVKVGRSDGGAFRPIGDRRFDNAPPARSFSDYVVEIDRTGLPAGIEVLELV
jgi:CRISPR-associated protein Csd2